MFYWTVVAGAIYGIPLRADRVLKIVPDSGEVLTVGEAVDGVDKWQGAVMGDDGAIYGIPFTWWLVGSE